MALKAGQVVKVQLYEPEEIESYAYPGVVYDEEKNRVFYRDDDLNIYVPATTPYTIHEWEGEITDEIREMQRMATPDMFEGPCISRFIEGEQVLFYDWISRRIVMGVTVGDNEIDMGGWRGRTKPTSTKLMWKAK